MIPFEVEPGLYSILILMAITALMFLALSLIVPKDCPSTRHAAILGFIVVIAFAIIFGPILSGSAYPETITVCTHNSNTLVATDQQVYYIINDGITPLKIHDGETIHAYIVEYGGIENHAKLIKRIDEPLVCRNTSICGV